MRIRSFAVLAMLTIVTLALPAPAAAAGGGETVPGPSIIIPDSRVVRDVGPGEAHLLGSVPVAPELQGLSCSAMATGLNNGSDRIGSDMTVASGGSSLWLLDVERVKNGKTHAEGTLILGPTLDVYLMGPRDVFSGGIEVTTECELPVPDPIPWSVPSCNTETGETVVPLENRGETPFAGAILKDGVGTVAANSNLERDSEPLWHLFLPGEVWTVTVNGEVFASGTAEDCEEVPPETTTTTTPPPVTTLPPAPDGGAPKQMDFPWQMAFGVALLGAVLVFAVVRRPSEG